MENEMDLIEINKKFLTPDEVRILESNFSIQKDKVNRIELMRKDYVIFQYKIELLKKELKILELEAEKQQRNIGDREQELKILKDTHKLLNTELKQKYDLPEKWGFDPESGEIKTE
jgi:hypothetical protein